MEISLSCVQIYNEGISDLLKPKNVIKLREKHGKFYLEGIHEERLGNIEDTTHLVLLSEANRNTGSTTMNIVSSRSHAIYIFKITNRLKGTVAQLHLVDLAGSERLKKSNIANETLEEMKSINSSLTALGRCIISLTTNSAHVPFRESKLTTIIHESFGGNALSTLIVTVSPDGSDIDETIASLSFGQRACKIVNKAKINSVPNDIDLTIQADLEDRLLRLNELEFENADLQNQLKETLTLANLLKIENVRLKEKLDRHIAIDSGSIQRAGVPSELMNILDKESGVESEKHSIKGNIIDHGPQRESIADVRGRSPRKERAMASNRSNSYTRIHLERSKSPSNHHIGSGDFKRKSTKSILSISRVYTNLIQTTVASRSNMDSFFSSAQKQEMTDYFELESKQKNSLIADLKEQNEYLKARLAMLDENKIQKESEITKQLREKNAELERQKADLESLKQKMSERQHELFLSFQTKNQSNQNNYGTFGTSKNQNDNFSASQQAYESELQRESRIWPKLNKNIFDSLRPEDSSGEGKNTKIFVDCASQTEIIENVGNSEGKNSSKEHEETIRSLKESLENERTINKELEMKSINYKALEHTHNRLKTLFDEMKNAKEFAVQELNSIKAERNYIYEQFQTSQKSIEVARSNKNELEEEIRNLKSQNASSRSLQRESESIISKSIQKVDQQTQTSIPLDETSHADISVIRGESSFVGEGSLRFRRSKPSESIHLEEQTNRSFSSSTSRSQRILRPLGNLTLEAARELLQKQRKLGFRELVADGGDRATMAFLNHELAFSARFLDNKRYDSKVRASLLFKSLSALIFGEQEFEMLLNSVTQESDPAKTLPMFLESVALAYSAISKKLATAALFSTSKINKKSSQNYPLQILYMTTRFVGEQDSRRFKEIIVQYIRFVRAAKCIQRAYRKARKRSMISFNTSLKDSDISQFFVMTGKSELNQLFNTTSKMMNMLGLMLRKG